MKSGTTIYLGGRFLADGEEPLVSIFDRGYLLGDSVFATLHGYGEQVFAIDAHLERFFAAAHAYRIRCPIGSEELRAVVTEAIRRSGARESAVRLTLTRGAGDGGFQQTGNEAPLLSVIARPLTARASTPISTTILETRALPPACSLVAHKAGSYATHVLARAEATDRGFDDGIMLAATGEFVVSGTVANLFLVVDGRLVTPSTESGARPGVMRETVLRLAQEEGIASEVRTVAKGELNLASELFFTSSLIEIQPIGSLDRMTVGSGTLPITTRLQHALRRCVEGEVGS